MPMAELSVPVVIGANVTVIVQLAPTATLLPQLLLWLNEFQEPEFMTKFEMLSEALPAFESVTVCGALVVPTFCWPNVRLVAERFATGSETPVPAKLTVCGLPLALSVMVSEALREPAAEGVNVTLIAQLAPAETVLPQVFVCVKSPALAPLMAILEMLRDAFPMLESVTVCGELVEPVPCWLKVRPT
jgi:hypothetical protein